MKTFKAICAALILAISLSIPTYAEDTKPGEVHTPGKSSVVTGGTSDAADEETGTEATADLGYSVLTDIVWALASIF
jgi:hypothetical protein